MIKLKRKIKTKEDFDSFLEFLFNRMKNNEPISNNNMLDGFICGLILSTDKFVQILFLGELDGHILDGTCQKLEQIIIWLTNNENTLIKLIEDEKI